MAAIQSLLSQRPELLERAETHDFMRQLLTPESHPFPYIEPVEVRILFVIDGIGGFDGRDFGLSILLHELAIPQGPWVRISAKKAYRGQLAVGGDDELVGFRFDEHDLTQFDQIWLFGVDRGPNYLSDAELRHISEFMNGGGGVFATGDHEDLGAPLCSHVPRVRNMRMWHFGKTGPNDEPVAPPVDGEGRHDTLVRRDHEQIGAIDHQSDDTPQTISAKFYKIAVGQEQWIQAAHPVMSWMNGAIRFFPDHPHEGQCYEPADFDRVFTFEGFEIHEYPTGASGKRPVPEVIAFSTHTGRTAEDFKGALKPKTFGAVGVYDGHLAEVGRVLVDSTWHHFFNLNLRGDPTARDPRNRGGFAQSEEGRAAYEQIVAYYRNIPIYLARREQQAEMRTRAIWWARYHHQIAMDIRSPEHLAELSPADRSRETMRIGDLAKDVLGRLASRSQVLEWALSFEGLPPSLRVESFSDIGEPAQADQLSFLPRSVFVNLESTLLGGALLAAAAQVQGFYNRQRLMELGAPNIGRIMMDGAVIAAKEYLDQFTIQNTASQTGVSRLLQSFTPQ